MEPWYLCTLSSPAILPDDQTSSEPQGHKSFSTLGATSGKFSDNAKSFVSENCTCKVPSNWPSVPPMESASIEVKTSQDLAAYVAYLSNTTAAWRTEQPSHPITLIACPTIDSIPPGRQRSKVLKCGVASCTSDKLFDRHFEMKRHMETHMRGNFPCSVRGCNRGDGNPFNRPDKLGEHMRRIHGGA